jgi:hypothetical protein
MKNRLIDLNNHLFEEIERLNDEELEGDKLDQEIKKSKAITDVAQTIVNNAKLMLDAQKHVDEHGFNKNETAKVLMIEENSKREK